MRESVSNVMGEETSGWLDNEKSSREIWMT